jgi:hypothetical protein
MGEHRKIPVNFQWDKLKPIGYQSGPDGDVQIYTEYDQQRRHGRRLFQELFQTPKEKLPEGPAAEDDWNDE